MVAKTDRRPAGRRAAVLGALLLAACGSTPAPEHLLDPNLCAGAWSSIYSPEQTPVSPILPTIRWSGDQLFVSKAWPYPPTIQAIPVAGGDPVNVYQGDALEFWIEGDRLLVASGGKLLSTPAGGGGPAEVVLTTHVFDVFKDQLPVGWSVDGNALYWAVMDFVSGGNTQWTIWRAPRDGSGDVNLGVLPLPPQSQGQVDRVVPLGDRVLVSTSGTTGGARVFAVPIAPGPISELPQGGTSVLGISDDGTILWSTATGVEKNRFVTTIAQSRADGSQPAPYWPGKPPGADSSASWPDGAGGWYVATDEVGTDQALHATVWLIDGAGAATRLACDPQVQSILSSAAVGADGLVGMDFYTNRYWRLVEISRGPSAGP